LKNCILLLDGSQKSTLAVLRSLGSKGLTCYVGEYFTPNLCTESKYCKKIIKYPSPYLNISDFKLFILEYIKKNNVDAIFPMTDTTIPLILDLLENTKFDHLISHIDKEKYFKASNKNYLFKLAKLLSIPYPETIVVDETSDLLRVAENLYYPVVIKPVMSKIHFNNRIISLNVTYAKNSKELIDILNLGFKYRNVYMVQNLIKGEGIGYFSLYKNGIPCKTFYHRRILEKPPTGGVSVLCEGVSEDSTVKKYATKLLSEFKWHGVAMVEFIKEYETGIPYLMEINARFWGSLELAIRCGVDFPYETLKMITENRVNFENNNNYTTSIRCSWITGLFDHFYLLLKDKKYDEIVRSIKKIANLRKKTYDFVFRKDDPRPFLYETRQNIKNAF
jgi:predicted ATP-grasp superfamily ATP-dependent carboligase